MTSWSLSAFKDANFDAVDEVISDGTASSAQIEQIAGEPHGGLIAAFSISSLPSNSVIESASLTYTILSTSGWNLNEGTMGLHLVTGTWTESSGAVTLTLSTPDDNGFVHFVGTHTVESASLAAWVQDWVDGAVSNHGVYLGFSDDSGVNNGDTLTFALREHATSANRPKLLVETADASYQMVL